LLRKWLNAAPAPVRGWDKLPVSWESESDCTSENGVGQFSIFGAVEEKSVGGFLLISVDQAAAEEHAPAPHGDSIFPPRAPAPKKSADTSRCIVHNPCTGNAERQWPVIRHM